MSSLINLRSGLRGTRLFSYGVYPRPMRDWLIILFGLLLLFIASFVWSTWFFFEVQSVDVAAPLSKTTNGNAVSIDTVRTVFEKRAAQAAHYSAAYFVDPSR